MVTHVALVPYNLVFDFTTYALYSSVTQTTLI